MAAPLADAVRQAARRAFPNECCGLIEGAATEGGWRADALHATHNLAADPMRGFLIDPEVQFRLLRALRGTDRAIIGCYHSHPNGDATPSGRDRAEAMDDGFVWLVAGVRNDAATLAAFVFDAKARRFDPLALNRSA
jgi:proteasome lid subunit RPN8/RPN11